METYIIGTQVPGYCIGYEVTPIIAYRGYNIAYLKNGNLQDLLKKTFRKLVQNLSKTYGTSLYSN